MVVLFQCVCPVHGSKTLWYTMGILKSGYQRLCLRLGERQPNVFWTEANGDGMASLPDNEWAMTNRMHWLFFVVPS